MEQLKKNKLMLGIALLLIAIGYGIGYFTKPTKVETVTVEKVRIEKQAAETKIVYREKITKPDGTVTEIEQSKTDTKTLENAQSEKSAESIVKNDLGLNLSALAISDVNNLAAREYGIHVTKRVLGDFTVGAMATTDKKIGVSVGIEF